MTREKVIYKQNLQFAAPTMEKNGRKETWSAAPKYIAPSIYSIAGAMTAIDLQLHVQQSLIATPAFTPLCAQYTIFFEFSSSAMVVSSSGERERDGSLGLGVSGMDVDVLINLIL